MERAHRDVIALSHLISEYTQKNHFGITKYGVQFTIYMILCYTIRNYWLRKLVSSHESKTACLL